MHSVFVYSMCVSAIRFSRIKISFVIRLSVRLILHHGPSRPPAAECTDSRKIAFLSLLRGCDLLCGGGSVHVCVCVCLSCWSAIITVSRIPLLLDHKPFKCRLKQSSVNLVCDHAKRTKHRFGTDLSAKCSRQKNRVLR